MTENARPSSSVPPDPAAPDWVALARLAAGEPAGDAEERMRDHAAERWLALHPDEAAGLATLDRALASALDEDTRAVLSGPPVDVEAALARVRLAAGLDRDVPSSTPFATPAAPQLTVVRGGAPRSRDGANVPAVTSRTVLQPSKARGWRRAVGLLAATALLATGAAWWRSGGLAGRAVLGPPVGVGGGTATAQRHVTGVGERQVLHLADGSQVVLGPTSTLDVPAGYGGAMRRVRLTGEGYFRAVHDVQRPFEVAAGDAIVHDLGTAFVVRAPEGAARRMVDVSVTDGAVQLRAVADSTARGPASPAAGVLLRVG
ncbi:MAG: FecR family protein, partial [Candidatus Eremiobacteraeota bacterium]|nr:FecR family protein [Candidatus Eremiobacteraeota bacterium]